MHFFTWAIHGAVVKDKPTDFVLNRGAYPAIAIPRIEVARENGAVIAHGGDNERRGDCGQFNVCYPVFISDSRFPTTQQLYLDTIEWRTILKCRCPGVEIGIVANAIQADLCGLHPGNYGIAQAV